MHENRKYVKNENYKQYLREFSIDYGVAVKPAKK